jgi:hypothetical protein
VNDVGKLNGRVSKGEFMDCPKCDRKDLNEKELEIHMKVFHKPKPMQTVQKISNGVCPDCGCTLWLEEGCVHCPSCGFSRC